MTGLARVAVGVVDDDDAVRDGIRFLLETEGYAVETFPSAEIFLAEADGQFACLLLDHNLPGLSGLDLAQRLRESGRYTPIMLVTGALTKAVEQRAASLAIEMVLDKPASAEEVISFVSANMA